jgi:hypothetical protein
MRTSSVQWTVAVVLTLISAVWQRWSGPTYPAMGTVVIDGRSIAFKLPRTNSITSRMPVSVTAPNPALSGVVEWRHYPTDEPWRSLPMTRHGDSLETEIPPAPEPLMPMAGKLEYRVRLTAGVVHFVIPALPAVTRFKGDVPAWVLIPHVAAMFFGMLFACRAALAAVFGGPTRLFGFVSGPIVQKLAFGAYWTGIPWGYDLTDNKTLIAIVSWVPAVAQMRRKQDSRLMIVMAAVVTMTVFAIPHSVWGSQAKW